MRNLDIKTVENFLSRSWEEAKIYLKIFAVNTFDLCKDEKTEFRKYIPELRLEVYVGFELGNGKPKYPLLRDMVPESWGVSEGELFEAALENTKKAPMSIERWTLGGLEYLEIRGAVNMLPEVGLLKKIAAALAGDLYVVPVSVDKFQIIPALSLKEYGKKQEWFDPVAFLYSHWEYERKSLPDWSKISGSSMGFYDKKKGTLYSVEPLRNYRIRLDCGYYEDRKDASIEGAKSFADMIVRKTLGGYNYSPSVKYESFLVCYRWWVDRPFNPEIDKDKDPIIIGEGFYRDWENALKED